jgi:hypothetical protein
MKDEGRVKSEPSLRSDSRLTLWAILGRLSSRPTFVRAQSEGREINLGPCCACGGSSMVRNILMLHFEGAVPGKGWGCFQCGLPMNGASAVVCDSCLESGAEIMEIFYGLPADGGRMRMPPEGSRVPFDHDVSKHPEVKGRGVSWERPAEERKRGKAITKNES